MNKSLYILLLMTFLSGCTTNNNNSVKRIPVAEIGKVILYYDEIPKIIQNGIDEADSTAIIQNYINNWAKREFLLRKAEENLSSEKRIEISHQLEETRADLVIYQYQRQMILEKMDTMITESEIRDYYNLHEKSFSLHSNIVKALFIKLPVETPDLATIKQLSRSDDQNDLQQLESYCYQFAEKFDDFNEEWVSMDRLAVEIQTNIHDEEDFLRRNRYYESTDSLSVYLISIRDYKLRSSLAPYEYVRDDIKRVIWNNRRLMFLQSLENGIYNEALKENSFKIY